jgi:hypothetical protein
MRGSRLSLFAGVFLCLAAGVAPAAAQPSTPAPASTAVAASAAGAVAATDPKPATGIFVAWGGSYWPAEILAQVDGRRAAIHYLGWGSEWDEIVGPERLAYAIDRSPKRARVGEQLYVEWQGSYWPARVVGLSGSAVRIHYEGWGDEWDEVVGAGRWVRLRLDRRHAEALAALRAGDAVEVLWGGSYWPARVMARAGADRYAIHYDGYGSEWDETVGPDRLRLP